MTESTRGKGGLVLDASVAINLFASGRAPEVLAAWPAPVSVERRTRSEVRSLRDREAPIPREATTPIAWDDVEAPGLVTTVDLQEADLDLLIRFSFDMDSGEAAAGAYAVGNQLDLAIDDRKARRVLECRTTCRWSLELMSNWARYTRASDHDIETALKAIRRYASWKPHTNHPLFDWWTAYVPE